MEKAWIPRNLNEEDSVQIGLGIKVRPSDLPFFATTSLPTYLLTQNSGMIIQTVAILGVLGVTYIGLRCKFKGQELPEIFFNGLLYGKRKRQYKRGG